MQDRAGVLHVVAAVIVSRNLVLAGRRATKKTEAGFWEFPGGKVESGETSVHALKREIKEELNLEVEPIRLVSDKITTFNGKRIRLETYFCKVKKPGEFFSIDHDLFRWFGIPELVQVTWCAPDLPTVHELTDNSELWTAVFENINT